MSNINVVTSIVGNRDKIIDDQYHNPNLSYIAFTSQPSNFWKIKPPCDIFGNDSNRNNAKIHKVLIHKYTKCDVSVWIDGNVKLNKNPEILIDKYCNDYDILLMKHMERSTIKQEAEFLIYNSFEYPHVVTNQLIEYNKNLTLCWGSFIIRLHNKSTKQFNEEWWSEICVHSFRDQLSLSEIASKYNVRYLEPQEYSEYFTTYYHPPLIRKYTESKYIR